jgi:hypothetical protein
LRYIAVWVRIWLAKTDELLHYDRPARRLPGRDQIISTQDTKHRQEQPAMTFARFTFHFYFSYSNPRAVEKR